MIVVLPVVSLFCSGDVDAALRFSRHLMFCSGDVHRTLKQILCFYAGNVQHLRAALGNL